MIYSFDTNREEIAATCERYRIERLYVFGSALREGFRVGESDIDLFVEFGPVDITKKFYYFLDARKAFTQIFQVEVA
jgi:uncharacterized protein